MFNFLPSIRTIIFKKQSGTLIKRQEEYSSLRPRLDPRLLNIVLASSHWNQSCIYCITIYTGISDILVNRFRSRPSVEIINSMKYYLKSVK